MLAPTEPEKKWFEEFYEIDLNGCWLWQGHINELGYGSIHIEGTKRKAHRVFWELHEAPIPEGIMVLHKCDVRKCVNPKHLFLGTQQDNMDDMVAKGRSADKRGVNNGNTRLTEAQVLEILELLEAGYLYNYEIADRYGVAPTTISRIKHAGWQHLKGE